MLLGDRIEAALFTIGVSKERVSKWLGDCRCKERQERLNALDAWARRVVKGKVDRAKEYLEALWVE